MSTRFRAAITMLAAAALPACNDDPLGPRIEGAGGAGDETLIVAHALAVDDLTGERASAVGLHLSGTLEGATTRSDGVGFANMGVCSDGGSENAVGGATIPGIGGVAAIATRVDPLEDPAGSRATASATNVSLLDGLIVADEVLAVAETRRTPAGFETDGSESHFVNLEVAGVALVDVAANTTVPIPGLGHVVLNDQRASEGATDASQRTRMIRVVVLESNAYGLPIGGEIVVADARARLSTGAAAGRLSGVAFGTQVSGGVESGRSAPRGLPCRGTDGEVRRSTLTEIDVPGVLTSSSIVSRVRGMAGPSLDGVTSNAIESVDVLNGLITATGVMAKARVFIEGNTVRFSGRSSRFATLSVAGHPMIDADVAANTRLVLDGIGTLWLNRVIEQEDRVLVHMIELRLFAGNPYGLAEGTRIIVGSASAGLR